jgi:hypothetical protein
MVGVFACSHLREHDCIGEHDFATKRQVFRTLSHRLQMHVADDLRTFNARKTPKRDTTSSQPSLCAVAIQLHSSKATEIIQIVTKCDSSRTSNHRASLGLILRVRTLYQRTYTTPSI